MPNRLSPCPRYLASRVLLGPFSVSRRWWNNWRKRRRSLICKSRKSTFQFLLVEVFKVYAQDRVQQRLPSRTLPLQLLVVVVLDVFKVYAQDIVLQQLPSRTLPLQFRVVEVLVVVFKVSLRIRAPQRLFQFLSETVVKVFSHFFPTQ